jgi:hypothetical protein
MRTWRAAIGIALLIAAHVMVLRYVSSHVAFAAVVMGLMMLMIVFRHLRH